MFRSESQTIKNHLNCIVVADIYAITSAETIKMIESVCIWDIASASEIRGLLLDKSKKDGTGMLKEKGTR
jgi:hypothetical protein